MQGTSARIMYEGMGVISNKKDEKSVMNRAGFAGGSNS